MAVWSSSSSEEDDAEEVEDPEPEPGREYSVTSRWMSSGRGLVRFCFGEGDLLTDWYWVTEGEDERVWTFVFCGDEGLTAAEVVEGTKRGLLSSSAPEGCLLAVEG